MSFKVLVVPEDSTNNGYILKPLVEKMLAKCGKPQAQVEVLSDPRVMGYEHAKKVLKTQVLEQYRFMDLILFLPDADGEGENRNSELRALEDEASRQRVRLLCCAAQQEVEVWLMAGHRHLLGRSWKEIRDDASIKETMFERFLASHGNLRASGGGRERLMLETLRGYDALLQLCPELADLERRIREILA